MANRNSRPKPPTYASTGTSDNFGRLYVSMVQSGAFQALSMKARYFYMLCTIQAASTQGKRALYQYADAEGETFGEACFVFPREHQKKFGYMGKDANRYFDELEQAGFIETVRQNNHRRKMNVYRFSDKWKNSS